MARCPEGPGQVILASAYGTENVSAHDVLIRETGQCPWCGREEDGSVSEPRVPRGEV